MHIAHLCADLQHCGLVTIDQALGLLDNFTKEKCWNIFLHFILHSAKIVYIFFSEESRICWTSHRLNLTENRLCALTSAFFGRDRHTTRDSPHSSHPSRQKLPKIYEVMFLFDFDTLESEHPNTIPYKPKVDFL